MSENLPDLNTAKVPAAKTLLIVTTRNDLSLPYFLDKSLSQFATVNVLYYMQADAEFQKIINTSMFDIIYFRDPFNEGEYDLKVIDACMDRVRAKFPHARYIDHTNNLQDILFEDKFTQYELLQHYMPPTEILKVKSQFTPTKNIIKKRISSRSRGIVFECNDNMLDGSWIIQPLYPVAVEYRVYIINGTVVQTASIKSSKTATTKTKVKEVVLLPADIVRFAETIKIDLKRFDFVGLDIIKTTDGECYLIEVNPSCQFATFATLSGINLAEQLLSGLKSD